MVLLRKSLPAIAGVLMCYCNNQPVVKHTGTSEAHTAATQLIILGTLQDGGSPHAGCTKTCCQKLFTRPDSSRRVVSIGLVDRVNKKTILIEATPDIAGQLKRLKDFAQSTGESPDAIFVSHAHIGHYSGLMFLGREAMNAKRVPVYVKPRMKRFLEDNGPWCQLVNLNNIEPVALKQGNDSVSVGTFLIKVFEVPHRDEFSETAGFLIKGLSKKVLFIPDIDKWEKWSVRILDEIKKADYVFIDGTFYSGKEINNRNIKEIPHPLVSESIKLMDSLPAKEKSKIFFIHLNHTNPLLNNGNELKELREKGYNVAAFGQIFDL